MTPERPGELRFRRATATPRGGRRPSLRGGLAPRTPKYTIQVGRTGMWPTSWAWEVRKDGFRIDHGQSMTQKNAVRTAERYARAHEATRTMQVGS